MCFVFLHFSISVLPLTLQSDHDLPDIQPSPGPGLYEDDYWPRYGEWA